MTGDELKAKLGELAGRSGKGRFFVVKHQPTKTKPVRVELRQNHRGVEDYRETLSTLIYALDTVADEDSIYDTALKIQAVAGRVDQVTGVYGSES